MRILVQIPASILRKRKRRGRAGRAALGVRETAIFLELIGLANHGAPGSRRDPVSKK